MSYYDLSTFFVSEIEQLKRHLAVSFKERCIFMLMDFRYTTTNPSL